MGSIFGKIGVETPKFELLHSTADYEIRKYSPSIIAQVTYPPYQLGGDRDGGFTILAKYIGALGNPQNKRQEKIAMTAPVKTQKTQFTSEKIAMTAPVITKNCGGEEEMITMQFVLPEKYQKVEDAPVPIDGRVVVKEEGERKYGVVRFSGVATEGVVKEKVKSLKERLEKDGYRVVGEFLLARYNPPWTLPPLRTNEIFLPIE